MALRKETAARTVKAALEQGRGPQKFLFLPEPQDSRKEPEKGPQ